MVKPRIILQRARRLRVNQTSAEKILWNTLRARKFHGIKFKRQVPYMNYILDFYSEDKKVVVELDGSQHGETDQEEYDKKRTKYLESNGIKVIRIWNDEVLRNPEGIYQYLEQEVLK